MAKTLQYGDKGPEVVELQKILKEQGYFKGACKGNFLNLTREAVFWFQSTHIDEDGNFLDQDGVVGPKTWWALRNPTGAAQASGIDPMIPDGLTDGRIAVLTVAVKERRKGVKEVPNGSNWGPEIKKYGGRKGWAWCALFAGWCVKQGIGKYPAGRKNPSCFQTWKAAEKKGTWRWKKEYDPIPGDVFIMQYRDRRGKLTGKGHTGIILRVSADGKYFNAIEGNTANRVKITKRAVSNSKILGYINPYGDEPRNFEKGVNSGGLSDDSLRGTR